MRRYTMSDTTEQSRVKPSANQPDVSHNPPPRTRTRGGTIRRSTEEVIHTEDLTKYYGKVRGIEDFTLSVNSGEIFGFLGPNGAGKTTMIRLCLGLISKTSGSITIFGMDSHRNSVQIRKRVGYVPGDFGLISNIKVKLYLKYLLSLSNCKSDDRMKELAARFDLDLNRKTHELSRGNRQKVGVIQAFMADQDLIILDEPTTGLDPLMQQEFYKILRKEKEKGKTIFMSSHILAEAEAVCDRVAIIKEGRLKIVEEIASLQKKTGKVLDVEFRSPVDVEEFRLPGVSEMKVDNNRLLLTINENLDSIIKAVANHKILNMNLKTYSLEELFLRYYKDTERGEDNVR
jgi:ABC-2 type transport system ATP-binding protein